jgi:hypothetical protein
MSHEVDPRLEALIMRWTNVIAIEAAWLAANDGLDLDDVEAVLTFIKAASTRDFGHWNDSGNHKNDRKQARHFALIVKEKLAQHASPLN